MVGYSSIVCSDPGKAGGGVWERESEEKEFRCVRFDRQRHEGAGNEDDARM